jgi:heat shock protein HtpX
VRRRAAANLLKTAALVLILAGAFTGVGYALGGQRTAALFAFCALLAATAVYAYGDRVLLGMLGARPFALAENPRLAQSVERLALSLGVDRPKLYLIDDDFPRAFVVGRGRRGASLAASTGLFYVLDGDELDAVIAHELAHVRSRDVLAQTFAVLLAATLLEATRMGGWFSRALLFLLAPVAAAFVHLMLSPKRELRADADAAGLVEPAALATALIRLDHAGELVAFAASPASEPLYTVNPFARDDRVVRMLETHPALDARLERLREI